MTCGLRTLNEAPLLQTAHLQDNQHLLKDLGGSFLHWRQFRYRSVEQRLIDQFPEIDQVTIRLDFPSAISISVVERVEVAYVSIPDGCVMVDKSGAAMAIDRHAPSGIPVIDGVQVKSLTLGQPLVVDLPDVMNSAMTMMGAIIDADKDDRLDLKLLPQISAIRPIGGRQLYLTVILPDTGEELTVLAETGRDQIEDMIWLRFVVDQGVMENRGKGVLNMTGRRRTFMPD